MTFTIRAHYDGQTIVPDEPLDLPVGEALDVQLTTRPRPLPTAAERREVLKALVARAIPGLQIPPEALRRESIYDE